MEKKVKQGPVFGFQRLSFFGGNITYNRERYEVRLYLNGAMSVSDMNDDFPAGKKHVFEQKATHREFRYWGRDRSPVPSLSSVNNRCSGLIR